jgi:peptidoglycan/xylan/chitin deacetylase (PgdA/CDA1 family)
MYHDVVPKKDVWFDLTVEEFEDQMAALQRAGATVVPLEDVVAHLQDGKPLPDKAIALTFDDGTLGEYDHAWPILKKYNYPATFFVHTAFVGVKSSKDHMTWDQLRELQATGLIDIQPHTVNHPDDLRTMSDAEIQRELNDSKAVLEKEMGTKVRFFAYPNGNGDERVAKYLEAAGYQAAWDEERAWDASPADRYFLARFAPFRLNDILEGWRKPAPERVAYRTFEMPSEPQMERSFPETQTVVCTPHALRLEGGRLHVSTQEEDDSFRVKRVLLGEDGGDENGFAEMPDSEQWRSIGDPIVVSDGKKVVIARYQPWMGKSLDALNALLPGATLAFVGADWYIPGSETQDVPSYLRAPDLLLHGKVGSLLVAGSNRNVDGKALGAALSAADIEDAILLR